MAAGLGLGLPLAVLLAREVDPLLLVSPLDPLVFTVASLISITVALGASLLPAGKATRVEPFETLRCE